MDFDIEIKQHLNQLLEEFGEYKRKNIAKKDNLRQEKNQLDNYFEELSGNYRQALNDLSDEYKAQGMSDVNHTREQLANHFNNKYQKLDNEFEETKAEYRRRAQSLR